VYSPQLIQESQCQTFRLFWISRHQGEGRRLQLPADSISSVQPYIIGGRNTVCVHPSCLIDGREGAPHQSSPPLACLPPRKHHHHPQGRASHPWLTAQPLLAAAAVAAAVCMICVRERGCCSRGICEQLNMHAASVHDQHVEGLNQQRRSLSSIASL